MDIVPSDMVNSANSFSSTINSIVLKCSLNLVLSIKHSKALGRSVRISLAYSSTLSLISSDPKVRDYLIRFYILLSIVSPHFLMRTL